MDRVVLNDGPGQAASKTVDGQGCTLLLEETNLEP